MTNEEALNCSEFPNCSDCISRQAAIDAVNEQEEGGKAIDRISLDMALETPIWQMIYATEPRRKIDVRMTYADLACIYRRMVYDEDGVRYEEYDGNDV